jgi:hypothetical protein
MVLLLLIYQLLIDHYYVMIKILVNEYLLMLNYVELVQVYELINFVDVVLNHLRFLNHLYYLYHWILMKCFDVLLNLLEELDLFYVRHFVHIDRIF